MSQMEKDYTCVIWVKNGNDGQRDSDITGTTDSDETPGSSTETS